MRPERAPLWLFLFENGVETKALVRALRCREQIKQIDADPQPTGLLVLLVAAEQIDVIVLLFLRRCRFACDWLTAGFFHGVDAQFQLVDRLSQVFDGCWKYAFEN